MSQDRGFSSDTDAPRSENTAGNVPRHDDKKSGRKRSNTGHADILYGIAPIEAALASGHRKIRQIHIKATNRSPRLEDLARTAKEQGVPITPASPPDLERMAGSATHQGILAETGPLHLGTEKEALEHIGDPRALLVALDEVQDPQNLGAIIRACAVFGASGVILPRHHNAPTGAAASKASAGWLERFPLYDAANLARFLDTAHKAGWWIAGTAQEGDTPLQTFHMEQPMVLVLGNEGRGLRSLVRKKCDFTLAIPTQGEGGLNVSAAAAVVLYQLTQFRH